MFTTIDQYFQKNLFSQFLKPGDDPFEAYEQALQDVHYCEWCDPDTVAHAKGFLKAWELPTTEFPYLPLPGDDGTGKHYISLYAILHGAGATAMLRFGDYNPPVAIFTEGDPKTHAPHRHGAPFTHTKLCDHCIRWDAYPFHTEGHGLTKANTAFLAISNTPRIYALQYRHTPLECEHDELKGLIVADSFEVALLPPAHPPSRTLEDIIAEITPQGAQVKKVQTKDGYLKFYSSKPRAEWIWPNDYKYPEGFLIAYTFIHENGTPYVALKGNKECHYKRGGIYRADTSTMVAHIDGEII